MKHIHHEFDAGPDDVVEVALDSPANVMLMDPPNYGCYQRGERFQYHGGRATESPFHITPPHQGHWHLVVDLGGYPGRVATSVRLLQYSK